MIQRGPGHVPVSIIASFALLATSLASLSACGDEPKRKLGGNCATDADCVHGVCGGGICIDPKADDDLDGLDNALELELGTNPVNADTDNDGTRDADELDAGFATLDIDQDGTPDVLESATVDEDNDCIPNQFDARNTIADSELAGLVDVVCKQVGVCGAALASLDVVCDVTSEKRSARCDYSAVAAFEPDEVTCDGLDNDCDGAVDEQSPDLDDDGEADCVDADRDGDTIADATDLCPALADPTQADSDGDGAGDACDVPSPPIVTAIDPVSPSTDATPTLLGSADANAVVSVFVAPSCDGIPLATTDSAADGSFAVEVSAGDNRESRFVLRARNTAGLESPCIPSAFPYVHDDTPPDAPAFESIVPTSPSTDDAPRVSGRAEANARVELHASADCTGAPLGAGSADASGTFSLTISVPNNASTVVHATAIDRAGNRSTCAALTTYVHDGERPDPPTPHPTPFTPASPSASEPNPVLRGCAEGHAIVDIYSQAGCLGALEATLVADSEDEDCATGAAFFGLVTAAPNATTTFHGLVRATTDRISACVPLGTYSHDSIAPAAPVFASASPTSPSSLATPTILGSAEPGVAVTLHDDARCDDASMIGQGLSAADGAFVIVATVAGNGATLIFAKATDDTGNTSACTSLTSYVHDDVVPIAPNPHPTTVFTPASPSNSDDTPFLRGCAAEGAMVDIFTSAGCTGTPLTTLRARIVDETCQSGFAFSGAVAVSKPSSTTTFRGATSNASGARSACATLGTFTFDGVAPAAPGLTAITPPSPASMTTPAVTGTADPGTTVTLYRGQGCSNGVMIGNAIANAAGSWTLFGSLEGLNTQTRFHANARDPAGNTSSCVALATWIHDDIAPRAPSMVASQIAAVPSPSKIAAPTVRFCSDTGTTVSAWLSPTCTGPSALATVVSASNVCATLAGTEEQIFSLAVPGAATYYVRARDAAGNRGECSALVDYVFDGLAPAVPQVVRVRGANWTLLDANSIDRVDLEIVGRSEPGASVTFLIDGASNGSAVANGEGRFEGTATAVSVAATGVRRLQVRATDVAGNVGATSIGNDVVGPLDVVVTSAAIPKAGVPVALHFPDGTTFVNGATNGSGQFQRRIFAGMGVTLAVERAALSATTRLLETWMDLMPGDNIQVDFTPPAPNVPNEIATELVVALPPQQTGATEYLVQGSCGVAERVSDSQSAVILRFAQDCAGPGDRVDVLVTALKPDPDSLLGASKVVAYAFRSGLLLAAQGSFVALNQWTLAGAGASTLTTSTLTVHNDTEATLIGMLQSQNLRGLRPDEFDIAPLPPKGSELGALYLLPGTTHTATLPFISEIGSWRMLFAVMQGASGGSGSGFIAASYEIEQGLGTAPASFGTRAVRADLLPLVSPDFLLPRGPDLDRPRYGWFTLGSLERADVASARFKGDHNCDGQCSDVGNVCTTDGDCNQGSTCNLLSCDELEWHVAWRPLDTDTTIQVPTLPAGLTPLASWSPSGQSKFNLQNVAWMDLDFVTGWDEAKTLGRAVFPFGDEDFMNQFLPDETKVLLSYLGDN